MNKVEWCDGLNTGILQIDSDHKQILSVINKISTAIEENQLESSVDDIFDQLEHYVKRHFSREEALLRRHQYEDLDAHIEKHQEFHDKIAELKRGWLTNKSRQVAEDISQFLINWLIHHIVVEDLPYIPAINASENVSNPAPKSKNMVNHCAKWLSTNVRLNKRILFTALLPFIGTVLLSLMIIFNSANQLTKIKALEELVQLTDYTGGVIHNLQVERGLSIGVLSTNTTNFTGQLKEQQAKTDKAISTLHKQINLLSFGSSNQSLEEQFSGIRLHLNQLKRLRPQIEAQQASSEQVKTNYTRVIKHLLNISNGIAHTNMNSELSNRILSFSTIMHLKEAVGLERALGVKAIESSHLAKESLHNFNLVKGRQEGLLQTFQQVSTPSELAMWQKINAGEVSTAVRALENKLFAAAATNNLSAMDSSTWFALFSDKMNELNKLADELATDLKEHASRKAVSLYYELIYTCVLLLTLLFLTLVFSKALTRSITHPIRRLTKAMTRLSTGDRNIRLNNELAHDELRQMGAAYELCRLGLLQGDFEDIELKYKNRESEFYKGLASIDSLTGAYNRREFFARANTELDRSHRYGNALSVIMVDLDHFKSVNDTYGHANGDLILQMFSNSCRSHLRLCDIFARIGGEEFAILLPETTLEDAVILANRLREEIHKIALEAASDVIQITASIGVAQWNNEQVEPFNLLMERADNCLYLAKTKGRDKVIYESA